MNTPENRQSSVILIQNLPCDIDKNWIVELFLKSNLNIDANQIHLIQPIKPGPNTYAKAFIDSPDDLCTAKIIDHFNKQTSTTDYSANFSLTTRKEMEKEIAKVRNMLIKKNLTMTCEWIDCNLKFNDRSLYLSHINQTHVKTYDPNVINKCLWQGCLEDFDFINIGHFQLHLSFHAFHNQLMNIGQQLMDMTDPKPICYNNNETRNVLSDLSTVLICGWNGCNAEFHDTETFFLHVDTHAIEDVEIPMISKEKLRKIRFAKCQWLNCDATFKKKSHLKMHLSSHTQKKFIACPRCGNLFSNRDGFFKHCYRQETPTNLCSESNNDNHLDVCNNTEKILTINGDQNQSSILIHIPETIIPSQTAIIDSSNKLHISTPLDDAVNVNKSSLAALVVNFDAGHSLTDPISGHSTGSNVIELKLATNHPSTRNNIVRKFRCTKCPKSFDMAALLCEHLIKHDRKFDCPHCPYKAGYPSRLKEHIQFRHCDNYEFKCTFCDRKLKNRRLLKRHIELHKGEKKNVCQFCQQSFTNYHSMNRHIRIQHFKEQMIFACHLCPNEYSRGNNLSRHLIGKHHLKIADGWSRFTYEKHNQTVFSESIH
ncbi:Histone H4 transcription factor [Sarcoptes scabiei]|uniref:Histone H4 transcription factor n=1 Tax=Sarcoptes scabiei TaxID=52283 RepID=A0A834VEF8_SARSC|nr:Histone H4 transcription factor [Sarcoptes scabiei]